MNLAVIQGAVLQCTCGSVPTPLTVTSQTQIKIEGKLAATVMDMAPVANITPFGACKVLAGPCVPAPAGPWKPGSTTQVKLGNQLALRSTDMLQCTVPGVITVVDPGQTSTKDE